MAKNGKVAEINLDMTTAADGRHPPFITTVTLPAAHPELPAGTVLIEGAETGSADLAAADGDQTILGVLNEAVEANEEMGNVMIHGSCPADMLVTVAADGTVTIADADLIKALQSAGIYV
jgi:hypothetical protein